MSFSEQIDSSPSPSFCKRLAAEKRVNIYFVPGTDNDGRKTYAYAVVSSVLHQEFLDAIHMGVMPDFAAIVEAGYGEPSEEIKAKMKKYYGFDEEIAQNDNFTSSASDTAAG